MDDPGTDALRKLAPSWTLAGDEQLLSILQNTHQRLLSKCQEANSQLEQMATALNDASISLQNVNNQFMSLSSSQFIESRVYDDDDMATGVPVVKEQPKPEAPDELTSLKRSISVLENAHEVINLLQDSDTESDTDDEMPTSMVLKPKDMYASRPLPYIIGSQPWKNKWHAGLLLEDSDSDSTASKVEHDSDQYSQSEPEDTHTEKLPVPHTHTTISQTSSEPPSEQGSVPKPTPSDVASEIARRLGARESAKMVEREPEEEAPPKPTVRKIYRPQDPVSSTIFLDEPPPLSDQSDSESDIFADLHRSQPYARTHLADDLFDGNEKDSDDGDIFSNFANKPATKSTSLFDSGPTPHMFVKHSENHHTSEDHRRNVRGDDDSRHGDRKGSNTDDLRARGDEEADRGVKKPVGGISLFGNKGTESIGAAILKRNQRKASTSGDESGSDSRSESQPNQQIRKEKDIFDDLFARSESKKVTNDKAFSEDLKTQIQKKSEVKEKKIEKPKVDLFSDNLFDDIDDIFSTNVVKMPAKDNAKSKSIFEDDDDLFSEIAAPTPIKTEAARSSNNKKSLFDSDDELFSENKPIDKPKVTPKPVEVVKPKVAEKTKLNEASNKSKVITKSIFDDDEDELFGDVNTNEITKVQNDKPVSIEKPLDFGKEDTKNIAPAKVSKVFKTPLLFDDDDESDLFAEPAKPNVHKVQVASIKDTKLKSETEDKFPVKTDVISSSPVKTDDTEQIVVRNENVDVNKDSSKPIVDKIGNAPETRKKLNEEEEENSSVVPVSKNVDSNKENVETNAAKIFDHIHRNIQNVEQSSLDTSIDYSDQDFDDLPPKVESNIPIINSNIMTETEEIPEHNIFDKTTLEEDIDMLFATTQQSTDDSEEIFKNMEADFTETIKDTNKTEQDNKTVEIATKTIEADIFSNILTEPPVFEKPKEPKRSKNVNALFDDDSDDESLFFKKNDPIFVENPEDFTPTQDRIFGLFTDEPPDDGFSKLSDGFDDDMFSTLPNPKLPQNDNLPPIPNTLDFGDITEIDKLDPVEEISSDILKDKGKPVVEITKESSLDIREDIFELPTASTVLSDDEQLFKISTKESKPTLQETSSPDLLSDDENLFTSAPKLEKPTSLVSAVEEKPAPVNKKPTLKNKAGFDMLSDDENLFTSAPKLEKPTSLVSAVEEKPAPVNKKPTLKNKPGLDMLSDDENLFTSGPKFVKPTSSKHIIENKNLESSKSSDDELFTSLKTEIPSLPANKILREDSKSDEDIFKISPKPEFIPKSAEIASESKPEKSEKKVGKLKVGLNINVNALLPGASPKKVNPNDQPDGQSQSVAGSQKPEPKNHSEVEKSEPEKQEGQDPDSKLLKSVSFDGKPESDVLDNKLSKERAKIQVKRRPSTRRARREAVRKSGIDFGEDSTDNSSSIDDPPRKHRDISKETNSNTKPNEIKQNIQTESIDKSAVQPKLDDTTKQTEIDSKAVEEQPTIEPTTIEKQAEITKKPLYTRDVKSKVVYILHDEDIFNTSPVEKPVSMNKSPENLDSNIGVTTLGKVYDKTVGNSSKNDPKSSLFGDENDEEIFKAKTAVKKSTIFDSDSEEELFGTSKREEKEKKVEKVEVKREIKKEVVKGSLFGDEDDDDDLFGVKTKKIVGQKPQPSRSTAKETPKPAEPVFVDPLSMFGDDD